MDCSSAEIEQDQSCSSRASDEFKVPAIPVKAATSAKKQNGSASSGKKASRSSKESFATTKTVQMKITDSFARNSAKEKPDQNVQSSSPKKGGQSKITGFFAPVSNKVQDKSSPNVKPETVGKASNQSSLQAPKKLFQEPPPTKSTNTRELPSCANGLVKSELGISDATGSDQLGVPQVRSAQSDTSAEKRPNAAQSASDAKRSLSSSAEECESQLLDEKAASENSPDLAEHPNADSAAGAESENRVRSLRVRPPKKEGVSPYVMSPPKKAPPRGSGAIKRAHSSSRDSSDDDDDDDKSLASAQKRAKMNPPPIKKQTKADSKSAFFEPIKCKEENLPMTEFSDECLLADADADCGPWTIADFEEGSFLMRKDDFDSTQLREIPIYRIENDFSLLQFKRRSARSYCTYESTAQMVLWQFEDVEQFIKLSVVSCQRIHGSPEFEVRIQLPQALLEKLKLRQHAVLPKKVVKNSRR